MKSSLLEGLKLLRDVKNDKKKKEKKKLSRDKIRCKEEMRETERMQVKKTTFGREEWMTMPYMKEDDEETIRRTTITREEMEREWKEKKRQQEIDTGMREPVTGMVYGLYDPKNPDAAPTISSMLLDEKSNEKDVKNDEKEQMPLFGDGGASWRGKMLKRAQDRALSSGVALEEVVMERFGSVSALKEKAKGSARNHAHRQYKRHRTDNEKEEKMTKERRTLETGRVVQDKVLLLKYATRVQRSVMHDLEDDSECDESRRQVDRSTDPSDKEDEEGSIDYTKLPDFDERGTGTSASRFVDRCSRAHDDDRTSFPRRNYCHQKHTRSRSRGRSSCSKRLQIPEKRSCSRLPTNYGSNSSNKSSCADQTKTTQSMNVERHVTSKPAVSEYKKTTHSCAVDTAKPQHDASDDIKKRIAFLYGNKKTAVKIADASDVSLSFASEQKPFELETTKTSDLLKRSAISVVAANSSAHEEDAKAKLNKLAAKALRAQMMGKSSLFRKLTEELNELEARFEQEKTAAAVSHSKTIGALPPLEKEDMRYGSRKGKKTFADRMDVNKSDVGMSLEELVREERMSSAHVGNGNTGSVHARNIVRLGWRYKGTEANIQHLSSGFDEEDQVDMTMLQEPGSNLTRRAQIQREHAIVVNENKRWDERTQKCHFCMKSPAFKKHLMLSLGEFTYLAVPDRPRLHPGHCVIVPIDHTCSVVQADEQVNEEIVRFQSALSGMCKEKYGMSVVFIEQTSAPYRKKHTVIECIPVDSKLALDTPLYFKQELLQVNSEWSTHKPIIDTSRGTIKSQVPPTFSYFHIEWRTCNGRGGYAHVIEDEGKFPRDFGVNVLAGMLDVTPPKFGRREGGNRRSLDDSKRDVLAFLKDWAPFDWTQELDGGEMKSQAQGD